MSRILVIVFVLLANKVAAGYHVAFDAGFAEFAQQQGFEDFDDFQEKSFFSLFAIRISSGRRTAKSSPLRICLAQSMA